MALNVILYGASGMVGQGVLRECLLDPEVAKVLSVSRSSLNQQDPKLRELILPDLLKYEDSFATLKGYDACYFCLGVSSSGMAERDYIKVTYCLALEAAETLARLNPQMTFVYVSGAGTDSTAEGKVMWARVKGKTENAILALPLKAFMFRPGAIQPLHGIISKTLSYRILYSALKPALPLLRKTFPQYITTTEQVGRAMLRVTREGYSKNILENKDISELGARVSA